MTREEAVEFGLLTVVDAAKFLAVSRSMVWKLMGEGKLPYVRMGAARRIPKQVLVEYAAKHLVRRD